MKLTIPRFFPKNSEKLSTTQAEQLAFEKLSHMLKMAKESLFPAFLGPVMCVPLFITSAGNFRVYLWFAFINICLCIRTYLIFSTKTQGDTQKSIQRLNWAIGLASFAWGSGWLLLLPTPSLESYLLYYTVTLIFIFINMGGNCLNGSTLLAFILPVEIALFAYYAFVPNAMTEWPIIVGAALFFLYSIKMGLMFAHAWEKNVILRFKNETLLTELTNEKNISVAANIAKSDFIATASHDLRQPMQAINIFLALLSGDSLGDYEKKIIDKLKISAEHLNKMFNTLLDISKLDAQSILVKHDSFDIDLLALNLEEMLRPIANSKGLNLRFRYPHIEVFGDMALLNQILVNLISNGLQYTKTGGVEVEFLNSNQELIVRISDTGCGMSPEDLNYIFKEFYRGQRTRAMHDGLGLGLSIVHRIIKLLDIDLTVESELDKGTCFTLKTRFLVTEKIDPIETLTLYSTPRKNFFQSNANNPNALHLAIIEDDLVLLEGYQHFFTAVGFITHIISPEPSKLHEELLNIAHLDFILSDYRLGQENGSDFIQKIREEFNADIPALIITADTSPEHIKIFEDMNIKALHKPIRPDEILAHMAKIFSQPDLLSD